MSETTHDNTSDLMSDTAEPSMEDILASIRRIIDEDEVSDASVPERVSETTEKVVPLDDNLQLDTEFDATELVIPSLGNELNVSEEPSVVENIDLTAMFADDVVADQSALDESDDLLELVEELVVVEDTIESDIVTEAVGSSLLDDIMPTEAPSDLEIESDLVSIDSAAEDDLLSDILRDIEDTELDSAPVESFEIFEETITDQETSVESTLEIEDVSYTEDSDIDLVKSLMADLTDSSFLEEETGEITESVDIAAPQDDVIATILEETPERDLVADVEDGLSASEVENSLDLMFESTDSLVVDDLEVDSLETDTVEDFVAEESTLADALTDSMAEESEDSLFLEIAAAAKADSVVENNQDDATVPSAEIELHDELVENLLSEEPAPAAEILTETVEAELDNVEPELEIETAEATADIDSLLDDEDELVLPELPDIATLKAAELEADQETASEIEETETAQETIEPQAEFVEETITPQVIETEEIDIQAVEVVEQASSEAEAPIEHNVETEPQETPDMAQPAVKHETILDEVTEQATADAFASLNQVVEEKSITAERGDRIGDLVMEALRPMLKDWLDENLKTIVERAVQKEVKRISSGK